MNSQISDKFPRFRKMSESFVFFSEKIFYLSENIKHWRRERKRVKEKSRKAQKIFHSVDKIAQSQHVIL